MDCLTLPLMESSEWKQGRRCRSANPLERVTTSCRTRRTFPVAPDGFIPNSVIRASMRLALLDSQPQRLDTPWQLKRDCLLISNRSESEMTRSKSATFYWSDEEDENNELSGLESRDRSILHTQSGVSSVSTIGVRSGSKGSRRVQFAADAVANGDLQTRNAMTSSGSSCSDGVTSALELLEDRERERSLADNVTSSRGTAAAGRGEDSSTSTGRRRPCQKDAKDAAAAAAAAVSTSVQALGVYSVVSNSSSRLQTESTNSSFNALTSRSQDPTTDLHEAENEVLSSLSHSTSGQQLTSTVTPSGLVTSRSDKHTDENNNNNNNNNVYSSNNYKTRQQQQQQQQQNGLVTADDTLPRGLSDDWTGGGGGGGGHVDKVVITLPSLTGNSSSGGRDGDVGPWNGSGGGHRPGWDPAEGTLEDQLEETGRADQRRNWNGLNDNEERRRNGRNGANGISGVSRDDNTPMRRLPHPTPRSAESLLTQRERRTRRSLVDSVTSSRTNSSRRTSTNHNTSCTALLPYNTAMYAMYKKRDSLIESCRHQLVNNAISSQS